MNLSQEELLKLYDQVGEMGEGLIAVQKDGQAFHIWPDGRPRYAERYEVVENFASGRAWVKKENWFLIYPSGRKVFPNLLRKFDTPGFGPCNLLFAIMEGGRWCHIDSFCQPIYEKRYDSVGNFSHGVSWGMEDGKYFYFNSRGEQISFGEWQKAFQREL